MLIPHEHANVPVNTLTHYKIKTLFTTSKPNHIKAKLHSTLKVDTLKVGTLELIKKMF